MADEDVRRCHVEGCTACATERAPGIDLCDEHWAALCDAYARHTVGPSHAR